MCQPTIPSNNKSQEILNSVTSSLDSSMSSSTSSCLSSASRKRSRTAKRSVSFDTVEVRAYPMILDESRNNTGLTIGWDAFEAYQASVEDYDLYNTREDKREVLEPLGYKERIFILLRAGYTPTDLREFMAQAPSPSA